MSDSESSDTDSYGTNDSDVSVQFAWERHGDEDASDCDSNEVASDGDSNEDDYLTYDSEDEDDDGDDNDDSFKDDNDDDDDDDYDDDSYSSEFSSEDQIASDKNILFISVYKDKVHGNSTIVSYVKEIKNYREKYSKSAKKDTEEIDKLWGFIKVRIDNTQDIPLCMYEDKIKEGSSKKKDKNEKSKIDSENNKKKLISKNEEIKQAVATKKAPAKHDTTCSPSEKSTKVLNDSVNCTENVTLPSNEISSIGSKIFVNPNAEKLLKTLAARNKKFTQNQNLDFSKLVIGKVDMKDIEIKEKSNENKKSESNTGKNCVTVTEKVKSNDEKSDKVNSVNFKSNSSNNEKIKKNDDSSKLNFKNTTKKNVNLTTNSKNSKKNKDGTEIASDSNITQKVNENHKNKTNADSKNVETKKKDNNSKIKNIENLESSSKNKNKIYEYDKNKANIVLQISKNNGNVKIKSGENLESTSTNTKKIDKNETRIIQQTNKNDSGKKIKSSENLKSASRDNKYENDENKTNVDRVEHLKTTDTDVKSEVLTKRARKNLKKKLQQQENKLDSIERDVSSSSSKDLLESRNKASIDDTNSNKNIKQDGSNDITNHKFESKSPNKQKNNEKEEKIKDSTDMKKKKKQKDDDILLNDEDMSFLAGLKQIPAFISETIKHKEMNNKSKSKVPLQTTSKSSNKKVVDDDDQDFILHTKKRRDPSKLDKGIKSSSDKLPNNSPNKNLPNDGPNKNDLPNSEQVFYSQKFAEDAVDMALLDNNLVGALNSIDEAISFNPLDHRHYLNRAYIYLRINRPAIALADAQYVISASSHIGHLFIANLRAGQASFALKNYLQAEKYFKEAMHRNPDNLHAPRELIRTRLAYIASLGFKAKDVILALEKFKKESDCVKYAINYLRENKLSSDLEPESDHDIFTNGYKDVIYSSENDESSTFEIINRMLNYVPGKVKINHLIAKTAYQGAPVNTQFEKKSLSKITVDPSKTVAANQVCNSKAIWVGNLTKNITDEALKNNFKQFGHVISIYRPINEAYAFINFEKIEDVNNVLINPSSHEVAGVKLVVRGAVRQK